jgi:hypothetical protein
MLSDTEEFFELFALDEADDKRSLGVASVHDVSAGVGVAPLSLSRQSSRDKKGGAKTAIGGDKAASGSASGGGKEGAGEDGDAVVQEMLVRSRNNIRFNHVRLGEIRIQVSYKGGKSRFGQSFEEQGIKGLELKVRHWLACNLFYAHSLSSLTPSPFPSPQLSPSSSPGNDLHYRRHTLSCKCSFTH